MKYIAHKDVAALLEAVAVLHSDIDSETLAERTIAAVSDLIETEIVAFDGFGSDDRYTTTTWNSRPELYTPESLNAFREYVHQHPLIPVVIGGRLQNAVKMTDYVSQPEFENLELYNEFFRVIGVRRQMGMALPVSSGLTLSCSVNRSGRDFSERDRLVLTLLTPHLVNAVRNSADYESLNFALKSKNRGLVTIDADGKVDYSGEYALALLRKYFPNAELSGNRLPKIVTGWLREKKPESPDFISADQSLTVGNADGELKISLAFHGLSGKQMLFLDEHKYLQPQMLEVFDLTRREAEILCWMAKGKTDAEIAILCGISPHTVYKHAQNIYNKLGVETRTAAMLRALEVIN